MKDSDLADKIIDLDARMAPVLRELFEATEQDFGQVMDDVFLRLIKAKSLTQYLYDARVEENIGELVFLPLPDNVIAAIPSIIGDGTNVETKVFMKNGQQFVGYRFDLNQILDAQNKAVKELF